LRVAIFGCGNVGFETVKALQKDDFIDKIFIFNRSYPQHLKESLANDLLDSKKIDFFRVDAEDEKLVETAYSSTIKGKIDALICTTGVFSTVPATKDFEHFRDVFNTNVFSNLIPIKVALNKNLLHENARIVMLSSVGAHYAPKGLDAYYASKWSLENVCSSLRAELGSRAIRVDVVCPRVIRNKYSRVFNFSSGLEPSRIARVIERILDKANTNHGLAGKNYFIPFKDFGFHLMERVFPVFFNSKAGLMPAFRRKNHYRKIELQSGLITGAASGLGKELAILYSHRLKNLFLLDKDLEGLEKTKATIESVSDCSVRSFCLDLNKLDEVALLADRLPPVDLLINCAGVYITGSVYHAGVDICQRIFNINFLSSVLLISKFLNKPSTPKKVINTLSIAAIAGQGKRGLYSATKAALWCFTRSLRRTHGNQIQVMEVLPAPFSSNLGVNTIRVENADLETTVPQRPSIKGKIFFFFIKYLTSTDVAKIIFMKEKRGEEILFIPFKAKFLCLFEAFFPSLYEKLRVSF
jgi:short-subunit dehydrogenase